MRVSLYPDTKLSVPGYRLPTGAQLEHHVCEQFQRGNHSCVWAFARYRRNAGLRRLLHLRSDLGMSPAPQGLDAAFIR